MRSLWIAALCSSFAGYAQPVLPPWSDAFLQDEVAEIHIDILPEFLEFALSPEYAIQEIDFPVRFVYHSSQRADTLYNVGFRLRGNTSLNAAKKSFKLSFNSFVPGGKWLDLEKLNLIGNQNDPSLLRAKLCWDGMRRFGLAGSRTSFVKVFLNEEYRGLYVNTEHIDENFAAQYFGSERSVLWKCTYPADLDFKGNNPDLYKEEFWGRRAYELKNNRQDDYTFLADFIAVVNNTTSWELPCALPRVFNVHDYLKYLALDVLTGNWDGYWYNKNNLYLLRNHHTGVFEYLPYDLDNTLGIDWLGVNWLNRDVYAWGHPIEPRALAQRILSVPQWRDAFSGYISDFANTWFLSDEFITHAQNLQNLIAADALADPYRPLDFGFTEDDFINAIHTAAGGHVNYSIAEFASGRATSAINQLDNYVNHPFAHHVRAEVEENEVIIRSVTDIHTTHLAAWRVWPGGIWNATPMTSTNDDVPWNGVGQIAQINVPTGTASIEFNVVTEEVWNTEATGACGSFFIHLEPAPEGIVINELQASGNSVIADEFGEYDDWIELFNAGNTPIHLGQMFITDKTDFWNQWRLPNVTLEPGQFFLLWADGQPEQGFRHLGFSLNQMGETLVLSRMVQRAPQLLDEVSFSQVSSGYSYGREVDGSPNWIPFETPTPGAPNGVVGISKFESASFSIYPNPASTWVSSTVPISGTIIDLSGRVVLTFSEAMRIDISALSAGTYVMSAGGHQVKMVIL